MIIVAALMLVTLMVLVAGVAVMAGGWEFNRKYSNRLMTARVVLQGLTIAAFALMYLAGR